MWPWQPLLPAAQLLSAPPPPVFVTGNTNVIRSVARNSMVVSMPREYAVAGIDRNTAVISEPRNRAVVSIPRNYRVPTND